MYGKQIGVLFSFCLFLAACGSPYQMQTQQGSAYVKSDSQYYDVACLQGLGGSTANASQCTVSRGLLQQRGGVQSRAASGGNRDLVASSPSSMSQQQLVIYILSQFIEAEVCAYLRLHSPCFQGLGVTPLPQPPCATPLLYSSPGNVSSAQSSLCLAPLPVDPQPTTPQNPSPNPAPSGGSCFQQASSINQRLADPQVRACNSDSQCTAMSDPSKLCGDIPFSTNVTYGFATTLRTDIQNYRSQCLGGYLAGACILSQQLFFCRNHVCAP